MESGEGVMPPTHFVCILNITNSMKTPLSYYSIDWLSVYCLCNIDSEGNPVIPSQLISPYQDRNGYHREYTVVSPVEYSHGYRWHRTVMWKDYRVAHISAHPSSGSQNPKGCQVKLSNAVLYLYDWYFILLDVISSLGWKPNNITRIDLCCDQNYFLNGLHPSTFIRKYAMSKRSWLRVGRKANDFALYAHKDVGGVDYNSIRWGSRQSGVSVYLYNKTKELVAHKDKPYIRRAWEEAGLNVSKDVWRVEISITSQGCGLRDVSTSVLHTLFVDDLKTSEAIREMFKVYASKYFHFVHAEAGKRKKDMRDFLVLNTTNGSVYRPVSQSVSMDTGISEKRIMNRLAELREYLIQTDTVFESKSVEVSHVDAVISYYSQLHGLKRQASRKEQAGVNYLRADILKKVSIPAQVERLRHSQSVISNIEYYHTVAESIAKKAMQISNPLHPDEE